MSITPEERPFVRASVVINSLRDNGYKNTAYAIAELIDNSIQAEAAHVQLVCFERPYFKNGRTRTEIEKIAIIDNGRGMDPLLLEAALAFGDFLIRAFRSAFAPMFGVGRKIHCPIIPISIFMPLKRVNWKVCRNRRLPRSIRA